MPPRNDIAKILIIGSGLALLVVWLFACGVAQACTIFATPVAAAPNFDLLVQDHGKPVAGIRIVVSRIGDKTHQRLLERTSDSEGRVPIRGLLLGEYAIDNLGPIQTGGLVATVKENGPTSLSKPILFQWPWLEIAKTKRLQGAFRSADPHNPFEEVELSVLTANAGTQLKAFHAGPDGKFDFSDLPAGLYVVLVHAKQRQIPKGWEVEGPVAVEVTQGLSVPSSLDLALGETSCGAWYAQCLDRERIKLTSRRIQIADPNGALVGSAQFMLEDESGKEVAGGQSDQQGVIKLSADLNGTYELKIYKTGFTPLEQPLEIMAPHAGAKSLRILMNVGGTCSHAALEKNAPQK